MLLPVSLDSALPDKALSVSGMDGLSTEKTGKNTEIEQFLDELLAQILALTGQDTEKPLPGEGGETLPLIDLGGNALPLDELLSDRLQALLARSGNDPAALMQTMAMVKQELKDGHAQLSLDGIAQLKSGTERPQDANLLDRLAMQIRKDAGKGVDTSKLPYPGSGIELDNFMDFHADRKISLDSNRLNPILTGNIDGQNGFKQPVAAAARDSGVLFQGLNSMTPVHAQVRNDGTPAVLTLQPNLFKTDWSEAFNSNIIMLARDQMQSAKLNINPPELGPIEVRLSMKNDQTHIQFLTHHGATREVIEDAFPRLREMMAGNGINLGDVNVSHQSTTSHDQSGQHADIEPRLAGNQDESGGEDSVAMTLRTGNGLVDHYI